MKTQESVTFEFVIQADLESLTESCLALRQAPSDEQLAVFYGQVIIHFLRGENEKLAEKIASIPRRFSDHPEFEFLLRACELRALIRSRVFDGELLKIATDLIDQNQKWSGELAMLLATMYTIFDDYVRATALYETAAHALAKAGYLRKSLRAQMNVLVCESHLHPQKNLFARYHDLYRQAIKRDRRETIVATTCLLNISREYQRAGAGLAALKYCNRALLLFERQMGEINYFLTLVHRAELLCSLGRFGEARIDVDTAKLATFPEVHAALKVVEAQLGDNQALAVDKDLLPTWRERLNESGDRVKLSSLEERLLTLLARGPRERVELVEEIYGERLDHETKQNRFKSLVGTFRRKFPDLIIFENSRYRLADEIFVPRSEL